jgi:hypothetical protein
VEPREEADDEDDDEDDVGDMTSSFMLLLLLEFEFVDLTTAAIDGFCTPTALLLLLKLLLL